MRSAAYRACRGRASFEPPGFIGRLRSAPAGKGIFSTAAPRSAPDSVRSGCWSSSSASRRSLGEGRLDAGPRGPSTSISSSTANGESAATFCGSPIPARSSGASSWPPWRSSIHRPGAGSLDWKHHLKML